MIELGQDIWKSDPNDHICPDCGDPGVFVGIQEITGTKKRFCRVCNPPDPPPLLKRLRSRVIQTVYRLLAKYERPEE